MGVPSVMKIKKGEVVFESKCDIAKYTIQELTRRAMMDVGRYVIYNVRKDLRSIFPFTKHKRASERYQYWVPKKEGELVLGIENTKKGAKTAWWADQLEQDKFVVPANAKRNAGGTTSGLGSANSPRRHLMETFVKKHVDKIVEIESQYLEKINNEDAAVALARATEDMEALDGDEN